MTKQDRDQPAANMALRDHFAGLAMQAFIGYYADAKYMADDISAKAYAQADAMLKARK